MFSPLKPFGIQKVTPQNIFMKLYTRETRKLVRKKEKDWVDDFKHFNEIVTRKLFIGAELSNGSQWLMPRISPLRAKA